MADYDRLYDSSLSSTKNPSSSSSFSFKTLHVFLLIGLIILFIGFAAVVYIVPSYHPQTKSPLTPNFCINPKTTDSNSLHEQEIIWAPNFCIVSNNLKVSEDNGDTDTTKPPIFNIKSMKLSNPFLSKEAVWNIAMSIENPNLGMNISYDRGVVYVYHGTTELLTTHMKAFHQASWGHRLTRWRFVSSKSLPYSPAASSIRDHVAHDHGYSVFRVLVQTMIKVYPSSSFEKHYLLLADCDGLKVDFPSGTMASGRGCQVQLRELTHRPSPHHLSLSMAF